MLLRVTFGVSPMTHQIDLTHTHFEFEIQIPTNFINIYLNITKSIIFLQFEAS